MAGDVQVQDGAVVPEPDDGFTPEERTAFEAMRAEPVATPDPVEGDAGPAAGADAPVVDAGDTAPVKDEAAPVAPDTASEGEDDDDEAPADGAQVDPNAKKPRRVSYSKFEREVTARDKRISELEKTKGEDAEAKARLDERMRIINEALTPKEAAKQDEDPEPDPETDIFAHNAWLKREMTRNNERNTAAIKEIRDGRQQEQAQTQVQRAYEDDAAAFVAREPNFVPAYTHLMMQRISQLALHFFKKDMTAENASLTPAQIVKIKEEISKEERGIVAGAVRDGDSPAERIFAWAKVSGYRPAPPATANGADKSAVANGKDKAAPGNLADAAATADSKPNGSVKEEIERVRKGSESGLSLSQGGGAPTMTLTPEKLANMPQDEFDTLMSQLSPAEQRRAMGG